MAARSYADLLAEARQRITETPVAEALRMQERGEDGEEGPAREPFEPVAEDHPLHRADRADHVAANPPSRRGRRRVARRQVEGLARRSGAHPSTSPPSVAHARNPPRSEVTFS